MTDVETPPEVVQNDAGGMFAFLAYVQQLEEKLEHFAVVVAAAFDDHNLWPSDETIAKYVDESDIIAFETDVSGFVNEDVEDSDPYGDVYEEDVYDDFDMLLEYDDYDTQADASEVL